MKRPHVAFVVTQPSTARFLLRGQLAHLARRGYEVTVVSSPGRYLDEVATAEGVRVVGVPIQREIRPWADLVSLVRVAGVFRRLRPDLVNAATPKAALLALLAARLVGVPRRIYTLRGLRLETATGIKRRLLTGGERTASACAHLVVCVGESLRRRYLGLGLAPAAKTLVLGPGSSNGVDCRRFRPATGDEAELRRALGIPSGAPVVGFVGRLTRDKGAGEAFRAFHDRVLPAHPRARLLVLGELEPGDALPPATRRRLAVDAAVIHPGFVDDSAPYYRLMDVLAFPSHREGFPNAPLEAAASGIPVVGYAATGTVDAVADSTSGTLVPVGNIEALGDAILAYLDNPELRRRHGAAARDRVQAEFSDRRIWQLWEDLYADQLRAEPR